LEEGPVRRSRQFQQDRSRTSRYAHGDDLGRR
jgi:hypothetical protein